MSVKIEGIENLKRQSVANKEVRSIFNNSLKSLVKDWAIATKQTTTTSKSLADIEKLFKINSLEHKGKSNYQASITITVKPEKLSDFSFLQVRITKGNNKLRVERKRKDKLIGPATKTFTKVKLLKSSGFKQAKIPRGIKKIPDNGNQGFLYKKSSRVNGRPSTPTGIYIRTSDKRYPIIMLRPVPLAYMISSKRIKDKINFDKRIDELARILGKNYD